ncbi:hypothetical protein IP69_13775 [Bosea sp. AAP35]|uniref:hypothetical protein n=1 Tax=Bosea sp. AAP35 TaxID=1523417 RepID=UPI0006B9A1BD|nr:hypothetical protein [Bosea sp. AAP35]KPF67399.1 hypothetical protein IP69_13775 [Bosea sp. AAP35]
MQPDLLSPLFDYSVVDGLGRARQRGLVPRLDAKIFRTQAVGPAVELAGLEAGIDLKSLGKCNWLDQGSLQPLLNALTTRSRQWLAPDGRRGLVTGAGLELEEILTSFKIDAHKAALAAGFEKAALLVAAMGEIIGNVVDHSEATDSGMAMFSAEAGRFEFVIADAGIGALQSLTRNPDHKGIGDEGTALQAMVETGVSRFAGDTGHGNGFRPIFEKLADMTGQLRFRSGDYALTLDGRFGDRIARQVSQKPKFTGLLAAVCCSAPRYRRT